MLTLLRGLHRLTEKNCFWKHFLLGWNTKSLKFLEEARQSEALVVVGSGFSSDIVVGRFIVAIELWAFERERERGWRRVIEKMCWSERKSVYIMCLCCVCVRKWYRENARTRHNHAHNPPLTTTQNSRTIRGKKKVMIANQKPKSKNPTKFAPISHTPISSQLPSANTQYATDRNKK